MADCMVLLGQLFFIGLLQTVIEMILEPDKRPYQMKLINVACVAGSLYLILQFVTQYLMQALMAIVRFTF